MLWAKSIKIIRDDKWINKLKTIKYIVSHYILAVALNFNYFLANYLKCIHIYILAI